MAEISKKSPLTGEVTRMEIPDDPLTWTPHERAFMETGMCPADIQAMEPKPFSPKAKRAFREAKNAMRRKPTTPRPKNVGNF